MDHLVRVEAYVMAVAVVDGDVNDGSHDLNESSFHGHVHGKNLAHDWKSETNKGDH